MTKCSDCYHLIKKKDGTSFCFAEGFIAEDIPPLKECPYYINKNEPLKPCPDCDDVHRKRSEFCKHCKIIERLNSVGKMLSKSKKIGMYSLDDFEKMIEDLHFIEERISFDLAEIIQHVKDEMINTIKGIHNYSHLRDEIQVLRSELDIVEQILDIDEMIQDEMNDIKKLLGNKFNQEEDKISDEINLMKKENVLSQKIAKLDEIIEKLISENQDIDFKKFLTDFKEISFHIQKMEK
ncbi:MAG: hypothetical protein ACTSVY_02120, partial [Candidatus Helarchaeota archaeon]